LDVTNIKKRIICKYLNQLVLVFVALPEKPLEMLIMGKTVPSYRLALEFEIDRWRSFKDALAGEENIVAFEELMDKCRGNAMAAGNACNPILFEPMVMSILLSQQKKLRELEYQLNDVIWAKIVRQIPSAARSPQTTVNLPELDQLEMDVEGLCRGEIT
jgi:hypothetical protein